MKEPIICTKGKEVVVLKSYAGYYLGTAMDDGAPYCRCSTEYRATREEAEKELIVDRHDAVENRYCNGGKGCIACVNR